MVDFGSKEGLASYREEDAAKTGHAVGSRGPGGGSEERAHGQRRFMGGPACRARVLCASALGASEWNSGVVMLIGSRTGR